jgi:hypothetical protein
MWCPTSGADYRSMEHTTFNRPTSPALLSGLSSEQLSRRAAWRFANVPQPDRSERYLAFARVVRAIPRILARPAQPPKTTRPAW